MFPADFHPKALRKRYNRKQKEIAAYLGLTISQYRRKEMNLTQWYAHEVYLLAKYYEVDITCFFQKKV